VIALTGCAATVPPSEHPLLATEVAARREAALNGDLISLPKKGEVTVIDFWSTSCVPCAKLMPEVERLYTERKADGLEIIGVAIDDNPGLVLNQLKERGVTYPIVLDPNSEIQGKYRVSELPQTFVFDRSGKLRFFVKGGDERDVAQIRQAVDALLAEGS
jgi:thiol-disulfide isomerase/thioredoxin